MIEYAPALRKRPRRSALDLAAVNADHALTESVGQTVRVIRDQHGRRRVVPAHPQPSTARRKVSTSAAADRERRLDAIECSMALAREEMRQTPEERRRRLARAEDHLYFAVVERIGGP